MQMSTGAVLPQESPVCSSSSSTSSAEAQNPLEIIQLNVGGKIFHTSLQTLLKKYGRDDDTNFFQVMFGPDIRNHMDLSRDENGNIFIDRDPRHFHVILNYLRSGELVLPTGVAKSTSGDVSRFPEYGHRSSSPICSPMSISSSSPSPSVSSVISNSSESEHQFDKSQLYELLMECEFFQLGKPITILRRELGLFGSPASAMSSNRVQDDNSQSGCPNPPFPSEEDLVASLLDPSQYGFLGANPDVFVVVGSKVRMRQLKLRLCPSSPTDSTPQSTTAADVPTTQSENEEEEKQQPKPKRIFSTLRKAIEKLRISVDPDQQQPTASPKGRDTQNTNPLRIVLLSGVYECLDFEVKILRPNVTFEGVVPANGDRVRIRSSVEINADFCQLRNLCILSEETIKPAVVIRKGRRGTRIEHCEITSLGTSCLVVESNTLDTTISHNTIAYGKEWGLVVREHGICTVTDNVIHTNQKANVWIDSYACPYLQRNTIHSGRNAAGVWIKSHSRAILEDNSIHSNDCTNIVVDSEADPLLRRNQVFGGKENGIFIKERALGTYEENDVHHNGHPNVALAPHAYSILRNNNIHNGNDCGIWVNSAGGLLEGNNIHNHRYPNITIEEAPVMNGSTSGNGGTTSENQSQATSSSFSVHSLISSLTDPSNSDRELDDNDLQTFYTRSPTFDNSTRNLVLRTNRVHSGRDCGIWLKKNVRCLIDSNLLCYQRRTNLVVEQGSFPIVRRNEIHTGRENGIYLKDNTGGIFEHNDVHSNSFANMALQANATPLVRNNDFHYSDDCGVWIKQHGKGTIMNNRIHNNHGAGLLLDRNATPVLRNNHIYGNTEEGVLIAKDCTSEFVSAIKENNKLENHPKGDVVMQRETSSTGGGNTKRK